MEELSKGMAQKLQFITTVVHKPSLMILDEPFSGFDPVNAELIRQEILRLRDEGATIILSTSGIRINAYRELVPRMNDIFIKLVTETEGEGK